MNRIIGLGLPLPAPPPSLLFCPRAFLRYPPPPCPTFTFFPSFVAGAHGKIFFFSFRVKARNRPVKLFGKSLSFPWPVSAACHEGSFLCFFWFQVVEASIDSLAVPPPRTHPSPLLSHCFSLSLKSLVLHTIWVVPRGNLLLVLSSSHSTCPPQTTAR